MSAFLVTPSDVPASCSYATDDDFPFYDEVQREYDWNSNPGAFDAAEAFDLTGNQTPYHAMLAILICGEEDLVISWVLAFDDAQQAAAVAEGTSDCDQSWGDPTFLRGNMLGQFEMDGDWEAADEEAVTERLEARLGVDAFCAE